jgi:CheY-like chemotaxis protein
VPDTQTPRVLLIDDDPVVRDSVQALLEYLGYDCGIAADGSSGLDLFERATWDLVITDLTMPGMTGWHVVDAIRKRVPRLPVIVVSGADDPSVRTAASQCRVSLLFKPFGLDALKAAVLSALDGL